MSKLALRNLLATAACWASLALPTSGRADAAGTASAPGVGAPPPPETQQSLPEPTSEVVDPWQRFTMYRPNYFITGFRDLGDEGHHPDVKFQVSVRYELLTIPADRWHLLLAYTQKSFWDIYDDSAPFRENNYNPEVYVQVHPSGVPAHYLKAGYAHESNGMSGSKSRSWDRAFAEARIPLHALTLYPTIWWPFRLGDNPRILRSFGWGELIARLRLSDNFGFEAVGRVGSLFDRGGVLAGLNVGSILEPFGIVEQKWFAPHLYLQLWSGYGESLIDYDVASTAARIGLMLRN